MKKTAVYPGSFDPVTSGHLDIIKRSSRVFDKLYVSVLVNSSKKPCFSVEERVEMIKKLTADYDNVYVDSFSGLLVDYLKEKNAHIVIKGLRAVTDFEYEFQMALTNKKLNPDIETLFLTTSVENMYLSSSMVKQIASMGGDISSFVPVAIHDDILKRLSSK